MYNMSGSSYYDGEWLDNRQHGWGKRQYRCVCVCVYIQLVILVSGTRLHVKYLAWFVPLKSLH